MDLLAQLESDLKEAIKTRDAMQTSVLRMVKSALQNQQIAVGHDLSNAEIITVLQKEAKKRQDAAQQYQSAGRSELAQQETAEAAAISHYLPAQLSDYELEQLVDRAIAQTKASSKADMGRVMSAIMPQLNGQAEPRRVSELVVRKLT